MNKKLEKIIENQNFIGISFIGDDLEGSKFIDDNVFDNILEDITKNRGNNKEQEIITMKCFVSNEDFKNKDKNKKEYNFNNNINIIGNIRDKKNKNLDFNNGLEIKHDNNNNKAKKIIKKEYIKDILFERKKINENSLIENEKDKSNTNGKRKNNDVIFYDKIKKNNCYYKRYHKSFKNMRNINTESEIKNDKINSKESSVYKKINQKSLNLDSTIKITNKEKINPKNEGEKIKTRRIFSAKNI